MKVLPPTATVSRAHRQIFAHVVERVECSLSVLVIDHFPLCPDCGHTLLTRAPRPWSQWCRTCKRDVESANA